MWWGNGIEASQMTCLSPMQVHQIQIDYARSAKRLDVKRLKAKMWQIITENIPDNKENIVPVSYLKCKCN